MAEPAKWDDSANRFPESGVALYPFVDPDKGKYEPMPKEREDSGPQSVPFRIAAKPPIAEWVKRIDRECGGFSSSKGIRTHKLYKFVVREGQGALSAILGVMKDAPVTAVVLAQEIVGDDDSPVTQDDHGSIRKLMDRWTLWGKQRRLI